jgi:hypothetical protein
LAQHLADDLSLIAVYRALGAGRQFYEKDLALETYVTSSPVENGKAYGTMKEFIVHRF